MLAAAAGPLCAQDAPDFAAVGALFAERCVICHSGADAPLGLHLDTADGVLKGREWISAMRGDAAASVEIALGILPISKVTLEVDLAMTVLTLVALGGKAGCALVLSRVLQGVCLEHPFAKELAVSWLGLNLRRAMDAKNPSVRLRTRKNGAVLRNAEPSALGVKASA